MPETASSCPGPEKLADLEANALPEAEAAEVRLHVSGCPNCQARLARSETLGPRRDPPSSDTVAWEGRRSDAEPRPAFLRPPAGPDELGRLGDYRVLRRIGGGGMGLVFEAEDLALGRRVALKVLRPELSDEEFRQRFLREARTAASVPHDHIVTIYQVGVDNGVPFLAMEYLRGESLEARLRRDGWLPLAEALGIARQAAEGLAVAHDRGLIHRDVKPDNLWLEAGTSGPAGRVKLLDFGLARPAHGPSDLTAPGQAVGTPGYMAPEVVYGLPVDGRADLYSLGCVLYRMLTGKTPFADEGLDTRGMLQAAAGRDVPPAERLAPGLPAPVAALLHDLLARDPAARPPTARAVIARLRELERSSAVPAEAPAASRAAPAKAGKAAGWRVGVWAGALTIVLAALIGGAALARRLLAPGPDEQAAGAAPAGEPITLGLLYSLSGSLSYSEKPVRNAVLQAVREVNASGGVLGRPVKAVTYDGESSEEGFSRGAEQLFSKDGAVALFGCWSSSARKRVDEVCARRDRLLVYAVPDEGLDESPNVFYLGGTPNQLMVPSVRWAYSELGKRRYFLAGSDYVFCRAASVILRHEVEKLGGAVVGEAYRPLGDTHFADLATEIERSRADVVLCTVDGISNVACAQALRSRGLRPPQVPTFWFNVGENELRYMDAKQMVGDYAPFCYFQSIDTPANRAFLERYRAAAHDPTLCVTDPMEASYFGVLLWKQAVETAGTTDTGPVREAFRRQSIDAAEGLIRIDPATQHAWRTPRIGRVNERLDFDIVWAAPQPVPPEPYPPFRTRRQWDQYLKGLYDGWGGHWEAHGR